MPSAEFLNACVWWAGFAILALAAAAAFGLLIGFIQDFILSRVKQRHDDIVYYKRETLDYQTWKAYGKPTEVVHHEDGITRRRWILTDKPDEIAAPMALTMITRSDNLTAAISDRLERKYQKVLEAERLADAARVH